MIRPLILLQAGLVLLLASPVFAGNEDVVFRFHYLHPDLLNPAINGSAFIPRACLTYNKQWTGIRESPRTMVASAAIRIGNYDFYNPRQLVNTSRFRSRERVGLGLSLFTDRNGPYSSRGVNLAYAYHLPLDNAYFSMGLSGSVRQTILDQTVFSPTDPGDPVLPGTRESFTRLNAAFGAYYYSPGVFGGIAIHDLIPLENRMEQGEVIKPDMILHGGYLFSHFGKPGLEIRANIRFLDFHALEYDLHFRAYLRKVHWIALSYRSSQAVVLHVGFNVKGFYLAYDYEASLTSMVRYQSGTHGIHLGINLGVRRTRYQ